MRGAGFAIAAKGVTRVAVGFSDLFCGIYWSRFFNLILNYVIPILSDPRMRALRH